MFSILLCVVTAHAKVHDIAVKNADNVIIYYNYINDGKELEVTGQDYIGSVVIPEEATYQNITRRVTSIGKYALSCCHQLTSVTIPNSVTSIGKGAFSHCNGLTSVTIPSGVTSIEPFAFSGCSGLTSISVKKGNTVYDSRGNCNAIIETATNTLIAVCKNTVIPKSVTSIGKGAFSHCNYLSSVTLPKGVTSIGDGAFDYCTSLKTVKIPASVTSIGDLVFNCCYSLRNVYCYAENVPAVANPVTDDQDADFLTDGWGFLGSFPKPVTLHVPASSLEAYRTTYPWKNFTKVVRLR